MFYCGWEICLFLFSNYLNETMFSKVPDFQFSQSLSSFAYMTCSFRYLRFLDHLYIARKEELRCQISCLLCCHSKQFYSTFPNYFFFLFLILSYVILPLAISSQLIWNCFTEYSREKRWIKNSWFVSIHFTNYDWLALIARYQSKTKVLNLFLPCLKKSTNLRKIILMT